MPDTPANQDSEDDGRVRVLIPLPLPGAYDYRLPPETDAIPGQVVRVPLGRRTVRGVVWDQGGKTADGTPVDAAKLRDIAGFYDVPPLPEASRRFVDWVAAYTLSLPGSVLRMCMSVPDALEPPRPRIAYARAGPDPDRLTPARGRVLELVDAGPPRTQSDLAEAAAVTPGVVRGLEKAGTLAPVELPPDRPFACPDHARPGPALSDEQQAAADTLSAAVGDGFSVSLLEGVTGSGKTEVYFEAIARALADGKQALVLLPEIALGAQWLTRFEDRFGVRPAEWHSDLRAGQRRRTWRAVAFGEARVVVGARSALFLPYPELGLVVVDEEHDASFKQEDGVIYSARDMAVVRGQVGSIPVVLASATPSLETLVNAGTGRYRHVHLPNRHGQAELPAIETVDLRADPPPRGQWLSPTLHDAVRATLESGEQTLLFLNRRGYAPLTLCSTCGHRIECPSCSAWLVEHRLARRLQCHHCGYSTRLPETCPQCGDEDSLKACGPGVERLAEEITAEFPDARVAVMASDTLHGPQAAAEFIRRIAEYELDLIIGTQVVAKGHHFPLLTLVGVIDADLGLAGGDLRATERTFQLLSQVAGRAGRAAHPGRVVLQTYMPDHPVIAALTSGDKDGFLAREADGRRAAGMPPFGRLVAVIVSGPNLESVQRTAANLARAAPRTDRVQVFGPAPAPLSMLRGRHRVRLLLKASRSVAVQPLLRAWMNAVEPSNDVRVQIDVDPYAFQ